MVTKIILLSFITGSLSAQAGQVVNSEVAELKFKTSNKFTHFQSVTLSNNEIGSLVKGKIRKKKLSRSLRQGHVNLEVRNENSELIKTMPLTYSPQKLSKRRFFASKFHYQFKDTLPENWTVSVNFHPAEISNHSI
jgi:hypothetical protein|tara:strand:+ start:1342 stop:1749 length:408 start_codon:yes stop_codon:yes gene_type:complete